MASYGRVNRVLVCIAPAILFAFGARADIESTPLGVPSGTEFPEAPSAQSEAFSVAEYLQTLVALGIVLALAVLAAAVFKRVARSRGGLAAALGAAGPSPSGVLEIMGRYPLGSGQTLVLLRFDTRVVLIHQAGGRKNPSMRTLSEVTDPEQVASIMMKTRGEQDERVDSSFRETIRKMEQGFDREVTGSRGGASGFIEPSPAAEQAGEARRQIDLLVGDDPEDQPAPGGAESGDIRGLLRSWVGGR